MSEQGWMILTSCILCGWVATAGICLERAIKRSTALVRARLRIEELEAKLAAVGSADRKWAREEVDSD